jgi:hypothetical protein
MHSKQQTYYEALNIVYKFFDSVLITCNLKYGGYKYSAVTKVY